MDIQQLADKLGIAVSTLIEFYAKRAPVVIFEGLALLLIAALLAIVAYRLFKVATRGSMYESDGWYIGGLVTAIAAMSMLIAGVITTFDGIEALVSPEAYAVDQILGHFK